MSATCPARDERDEDTMTTTRTVDRYRVNDALTALAAEHGATLPDDVLNDLTHTVAAAIEGKPTPRDEQTVYRWTAADVDALAGREATPEELARIEDATGNSTAGEAFAAAVEQVTGLPLLDEELDDALADYLAEHDLAPEEASDDADKITERLRAAESPALTVEQVRASLARLADEDAEPAA